MKRILIAAAALSALAVIGGLRRPIRPAAIPARTAAPSTATAAGTAAAGGATTTGAITKAGAATGVTITTAPPTASAADPGADRRRLS